MELPEHVVVGSGPRRRDQPPVLALRLEAAEENRQALVERTDSRRTVVPDVPPVGESIEAPGPVLDQA